MCSILSPALVNICTTYEKNPSRTADTTQWTWQEVKHFHIFLLKSHDRITMKINSHGQQDVPNFGSFFFHSKGWMALNIWDRVKFFTWDETHPFVLVIFYVKYGKNLSSTVVPTECTRGITGGWTDRQVNPVYPPLLRQYKNPVNSHLIQIKSFHLTTISDHKHPI